MLKHRLKNIYSAMVPNIEAVIKLLMLCHTFKYYGSNAKGKGVKGGENEKRGEKEKRKKTAKHGFPTFLFSIMKITVVYMIA